MVKKAVDVVVEAEGVEEFTPLTPLVGEDVDTTVLSNEYERLIVQQLRSLLDASKVNLRESVKMGRIAISAVFFHQGLPVALTFIMLLVSGFVNPTTQIITCAAIFTVLYVVCMSVQVHLLWACITEKKQRTATVMGEVLDRWERRIQVMAQTMRQSQQERWAVFRSSFAVLPAKAFRVVAVVDVSTWRLKYILKCLLIKHSKRLDEVTLSVRRYMEPLGLCKLIDVMRASLEHCAIMLRPLQDRARPPRHPNLHIETDRSAAAAEEEEVTTDDSDHDHDPRVEHSGPNTSSVSQQMEFFVHRIALLTWVLGILLTVVAGYFFHVTQGTPLIEGIFLYSSVALLGMVPVNAILLNRVLVLYANMYLDRLFRYLVAKPSHSLDDRIPRFSFLSTMRILRRRILNPRQDEGHQTPLCFSSSIVESLGMATVVALLDATGVLTDMVLLPTNILMLKGAEQPESSSSSDDEAFAGAGDDEGPNHKCELKRQVRRKKLQERRFLELSLAPLQQGDDFTAVQFTDSKEYELRRQNVSPIALCLLLHALLPEPVNLETWTEPFRFCDRTFAWARSTHWVSRAAGFDDSVATSFRVLARIFQIDTKTRTGYRRDYPEQSCTLLLEGVDDHSFHAFTIGTVPMVTRNCPFYWTGTSIAELDVEARAGLVDVGKRSWEEGMDLEVVATSHHMLPESYAPCVEFFPPGRSGYAEFFFFNGVQATAKSNGLTAKCHPQTQSSLFNTSREEVGLNENTSNNGDNANAEGGDEKNCREGRNEGCSGDGDDIGNLPGDDHVPKTLDKLIAYVVGSTHTFLGLVGLRDSLRPNVQNTMSVLDEAGIRSMFFSAQNARRTKSFGSRLGLETDWNCCIALKEGVVELDQHSIRAQLPVGIKSIRKHILHVDPIPLQVNMFSHANSASTRAMLSILQDNHEVTVAIGSVFNHGNVRSFIQADMAIGVMPTRRGPMAEKELTLGHGRVFDPSDFTAAQSSNKDLPLYRNVAELIECTCSLSASSTSSILPIVTTLIRQARLRLSGIGNCVEFTMHANFFITMINVIAVLTGAPLLISPCATIFELNVIIPILALSCTYTAYAGTDTMKTISSRHNYFVRLAIFRHSAIVWGMRYIPSLVALLALGLTCGVRMCGRRVTELALFSSDKCIIATRGYILLTLNYWLMVHSWTHMSRHYPLSPNLSFKTRYGKRSTYLFCSFRWVSAIVLTIGSTILFVIIDNASYNEVPTAMFPSIPHTVVSILFPIVLLLLDVPIKAWRLRRFNLMQKFRRLSFGTRLGMHSPRGDYEPEGVTTFANNTSAEVEATYDRTPTRWQQLQEAFYRFATMRRGKLELNCVCCDHIGGNYATYHVSANNV